ncbi:MAG: hypothetical protein V3U65_14905 [Granulosicoccaceae bacterium]
MPISKLNRTTRAWALSFVAAGLITACNGGGDSNGNSTPPAGTPGSNPESSLSFSHTTDSNIPSPAQAKGGVLQTILSSQSDSTQAFAELQLKVFGPMCSGCHSGGGITQPSNTDFSNADASYAALVNQASTRHPNKKLVTPGNSAQSYLVNTLNGTQEGGSRMPMRSTPLNDDLMAAVRLWIDQGAKRN